MNNTIRFLTPILIATQAATLLAETRTETKSFSLQGVTDLDMDFSHLDMEIMASNDDAIGLTLTQEFRGDANPECLMVISNKTNGPNKLSLETKFVESSSSRRCRVNRRLKINLGSTKLTALKLDLNHGKLKWDTLRALKVDIETAHGSSEIAKAQLTDGFEFEAKHGDVKIGSLKAKSADIEGKHGDANITAIDVTEKVAIAWRHGNLDIEDLSASQFEITQNHGDLQVKDLKAGTIKGENSHGSAKLAMTAQSLNWESRHSKLTLNGKVSQRVEIDGEHGSFNLDGQFGQVALVGSHTAIEFRQTSLVNGFSLDARTSHQDIDVFLPKAFQSELDLRADEINIIDSDRSQSFARRVQQKDKEASGQLLKLHSSHGDINIRKTL